MVVCAAILNQMMGIAHFLLDQHMSGCSSVQQYISMDRESAWGIDIEILTLVHLLQTSIPSYDTQYSTWIRYNLKLLLEL